LTCKRVRVYLAATVRATGVDTGVADADAAILVLLGRIGGEKTVTLLKSDKRYRKANGLRPATASRRHPNPSRDRKGAVPLPFELPRHRSLTVAARITGYVLANRVAYHFASKTVFQSTSTQWPRVAETPVLGERATTILRVSGKAMTVR
jgi:hypothetical protein